MFLRNTWCTVTKISFLDATGFLDTPLYLLLPVVFKQCSLLDDISLSTLPRLLQNEPTDTLSSIASTPPRYRFILLLVVNHDHIHS